MTANDVGVEVVIELRLTKEEFTFVTKALCGTLREDDVEHAQILGEQALRNFAKHLDDKASAAKHALDKALEQPLGKVKS